MPKRKKSIIGTQERLKDRDRKRKAREKAKSVDGTSGDQDAGSSVPRGIVDGAFTAPPSNFLGQVSVGFPLKEEKPLARVQASLCEKMHPAAPRLPPPRGSRLSVQKGMAPSPDSPPWVCAPPRAPGPDTVQVSGPAAQAQLEDSWMECTSRKLKDDEDSVTISNEDSVRISNQYLETISNQYSVTISNSILGDNNIMKTIYENENNDVSENDDDDPIYGDENKCKRNAVNSCQNAPKRSNYEVCQSVQGTFHQADILFEDNAGTQCVANCLAALAYHKLKSAKYWSSNDMNRILMTGDELYT